MYVVCWGGQSVREYGGPDLHSSNYELHYEEVAHSDSSQCYYELGGANSDLNS